LVLDTQGVELLVLKGAVPLFTGLQYIKAEAADFESYRGGTTVAELKSFLGSHNFAATRAHAFVRHPDGGTYYDILFKKIVSEFFFGDAGKPRLVCRACFA
jgi:hypothetical protein